MTEVANFAFDANYNISQGQDFVRSRTGDKGMGVRFQGTADALTIADMAALHRKSYGCGGSRDRRGSPCVVSRPLGDVSYQWLMYRLGRRVLVSFLVV